MENYNTLKCCNSVVFTSYLDEITATLGSIFVITIPFHELDKLTDQTFLASDTNVTSIIWCVVFECLFIRVVGFSSDWIVGSYLTELDRKSDISYNFNIIILPYEPSLDCQLMLCIQSNLFECGLPMDGINSSQIKSVINLSIYSVGFARKGYDNSDLSTYNMDL